MFDLVFVVFIILIVLLVYKDRKNVKREGIILMRRTTRGKKGIDNIAKKFSRFWNVLSTLGIIAAVPALIFISSFLLINSFGIISGEVSEGARLILPWSVEKAELAPGVLFLPWWIWVIVIVSIMVPHELFHGIICRLENVRIKSMGWLLLLFIPGAFVEPDEKELKKRKRLTKLKVYAAGSFANFLMAALFLVILELYTTSFFVVGGIVPTAAIPGYPAADANMSGAFVSINNIPITSQENLSTILDTIPPGTNITIQTTTGLYSIVTAKHPELNKSFIGVSGPYYSHYVVSKHLQNYAPILENLMDLLGWVFYLNLIIGLVNLLPIKPLDGGMFFEEIVKKFTKRSRFIVRFVSGFMLFLLVFNLLGPLVF